MKKDLIVLEDGFFNSKKEVIYNNLVAIEENTLKSLEMTVKKETLELSRQDKNGKICEIDRLGGK